ncbi:unnamed protein product [Didymodactylos carnosus]|uniref:Uncharacterized protein n=1 Tax=Didymodactylos carnosus TaxID=1234261 RepID=A0A814LEY6_9BILA|nr:unnamed protein product [Didymodactylos carnosus]CAF1135958.1 unnamed protein product [Didymodactylos carnosus]CAF3832166.1 unnamed protein product [Didymodactylos carnosus]CAF3924804.1 unnamed protein product [Didymodactylos carnosus]
MYDYRVDPVGNFIAIIHISTQSGKADFDEAERIISTAKIITFDTESVPGVNVIELSHLFYECYDNAEGNRNKDKIAGLRKQNVSYQQPKLLRSIPKVLNFVFVTKT